MCDSAARFETSIPNPFRPTWINYSGGDTFHSVAATGNAVYVQGHFRALDNPNGTNGPLPGSSPRQGIGAIDPVGGHALSWDPGKTRGIGGKDFLVTPAGPLGGQRRRPDRRRVARQHRADAAVVGTV